MSARIIDGKAVSDRVKADIATQVAALKARGQSVGLAVILVGDDPASHLYVCNKEKACGRLGLYSRTVRLPADTTQEALEAEVRLANADPAIHGLLVQLPLPKHLDGARALSLSGGASPGCAPGIAPSGCKADSAKLADCSRSPDRCRPPGPCPCRACVSRTCLPTEPDLTPIIPCASCSPTTTVISLPVFRHSPVRWRRWAV